MARFQAGGMDAQLVRATFDELRKQLGRPEVVHYPHWTFSPARRGYWRATLRIGGRNEQIYVRGKRWYPSGHGSASSEGGFGTGNSLAALEYRAFRAGLIYTCAQAREAERRYEEAVDVEERKHWFWAAMPGDKPWPEEKS